MKLSHLFRSRRSSQSPVLPEPQALDSTPIRQARLVVLDLETSGLDTQRDDILSIGAVAVRQGTLFMADQFERTLHQPDHQPNQATLLHEIAPCEIQRGQPVEAALLDFMHYAGTSVLIAFHAGFEQRMLTRSLRQTLGCRLQHRFLDVAELAPMLYPEAAPRCGSLDDWQSHFQLTNSERHNASADAMVTAEILLILLNRLDKQGTNSLAELNNRVSDWRRLNRARAIRL
ncbi:MAG: 3'-5' exonuclease [Gammaproteobacteria bacterium]|nr:3'-5' exonuclease [Gammaproteobacteria bacterium]